MGEHSSYYEYDGDDSFPPGERGKVATTIRFIIKTFFTMVIIFVLAILFYRMLSKGDPKIAREYIWDNSALASYNQTENKDDFKIYRYKIAGYKYYDEAESKNVAVNYSEFNENRKNGKIHGTFRVNNMFYTENTNQLQFTVRYNKSAITHLMEEYELTETPSGQSFVFALTDENNNIIKEYSYVEAKKSVYLYRRLVFKDVNLDEINLLTLNIYFKDDVDFTKNAYISMIIYDSKIKLEPLKLSDIASPKQTVGIKAMPSYNIKDE